MPTRRTWQCKTRHPKSQFSIKVRSIHEDSAIDLDKWLMATWMLTSGKNGVSSYEMHRAIGVTQKRAWFMSQRIRLSMQDGDNNQLSGHVEVNEAFIGGKAHHMHLMKRRTRIKGTGGSGRVVVMGMFERGSKSKRQSLKTGPQ
jgi:hypothetical protein